MVPNFMHAAVLMKTSDMRVREKEVLCFVSYIYKQFILFTASLFVCLSESRIRGVVSSIPQSLRIPRSHLKMSNTSIGQGKLMCSML